MKVAALEPAAIAAVLRRSKPGLCRAAIVQTDMHTAGLALELMSPGEVAAALSSAVRSPRARLSLLCGSLAAHRNPTKSRCC